MYMSVCYYVKCNISLKEKVKCGTTLYVIKGLFNEIIRSNNADKRRQVSV